MSKIQKEQSNRIVLHTDARVLQRPTQNTKPEYLACYLGGTLIMGLLHVSQSRNSCIKGLSWYPAPYIFCSSVSWSSNRYHAVGVVNFKILANYRREQLQKFDGKQPLSLHLSQGCTVSVPGYSIRESILMVGGQFLKLDRRTWLG